MPRIRVKWCDMVWCPIIFVGVETRDRNLGNVLGDVVDIILGRRDPQ